MERGAPTARPRARGGLGRVARRYARGASLMERPTFCLDLKHAVLSAWMEGMALTLAPFVAHVLGAGPGLQTLIGIGPGVGMIFALIFGHWASGGATMRFFVWPGLVARALLLLVALRGGPGGFVAILLAFHAISTIQKPAYLEVLGANYSAAHRGWLISRIRIARSVCLMVGAAIAGSALEANSDLYRAFYPVAGLLGIAGVLSFARIRIRRERSRGAGRRRAGFLASIRAVARDRRYLVFLAVLFVSTFGGKLAIPVEPRRLQGELGLDLEALGLVFGPVCQGVAIAGFVFWGRLVDRKDPSWLLAACFAFLAVRPLLYAVATPRNAAALVAIGAASQRFAISGIELCWMLAVIRFAGRERVALYTGAYITLIGVRLLLGPVLGNALFQLGVRPVGIYWIVFAIIASGVLAMAVLAARRPTPRR